ncbi:MAG: hypothetical protein ACR2G3_03275 [Solirubrobacterales bacterium]
MDEQKPQDDTDPSDDDADAGAQDDTDPSDDDASGRQDISDTPAPSVGPNTTIETEPPEERLARHEQSSVDAMGLEKRREVVGGSYGASFGKQATLYGGALAIVAAIVIGFIVLAGELDKPPESNPDEAPWSNPDAPQTPPSPLQ